MAYIKILAWSLIIGILCFTPGNEFKEVKINIPHFDKIVHFGMFYILGLLLKANNKLTKKQFHVLLLLSIIYAALIEVIQHNYVHLRNGDVFDLASDIFGLFIGIFTFKLYPKYLTKLIS